MPRRFPVSSAIQRVFPANIFGLLPSFASVNFVQPRFCMACQFKVSWQAFFAFVWCKNSGFTNTAVHYPKAGNKVFVFV
ncbi:hypothetical protein M3P05_20785, partial [Sansalvadorimonas sp. 2012CJ34-2]